MKAKFIYSDESYMYIEYPTPPKGLSKQINKRFSFPIKVEFQGDSTEVKNQQNLQNWKAMCYGFTR